MTSVSTPMSNSLVHNIKEPVGIFHVSRDNLLVLDIFFEALNYEKIEQKKAYEIAGLLGKHLTL